MGGKREKVARQGARLSLGIRKGAKCRPLAWPNEQQHAIGPMISWGGSTNSTSTNTAIRIAALSLFILEPGEAIAPKERTGQLRPNLNFRHIIPPYQPSDRSTTSQIQTHRNPATRQLPTSPGFCVVNMDAPHFGHALGNRHAYLDRVSTPDIYVSLSKLPRSARW